MNFETTISGFLFKMTDGGLVEISYASDKDHDCIQRFMIKDCTDKVKFEKECAFWYMDNGNQLSWNR